MPVFKVGNYNQINLSLHETARVIDTRYKSKVKPARNLPNYAMQELSFNIEIPSIDLARSPNKWGLYLKSLSLYRSFEAFIVNLFNPANQIYFTSIAWDYSGCAPFVYPPKGTRGEDFIIPMKAKTSRKFIGDGVCVWPSKIVVGALNLIILVYESDSNVNKLGETLIDIHDKVGNSKLTSLISAISNNPSLTMGVAIEEAVNELLGVVGNIMKRNQTDYVDLFEGSYGTDKPQSARIEKYDHESAGIEIDFTVVGA